MALELEVAMRDLNLSGFQPYVARIAPIELGAGLVEASGTAKVGGGGEGSVATFAGDVTIHEIDLMETVIGSHVLKWGRVDARGINAGIGPQTFEMATLDIHGAGIEVVVSSDGKVNLIEFLAAMSEKSKEAPGEETDGEGDEMLSISVGAVTLHGCSAAYTDRTLSPAFTMAVDPVDGSIKSISTTGTAGAALDIKGPVRSGGDLHLEGEMDLFDVKRLTDLAIDIRQAKMPPASPMAVRYVGHPINQGEVDISLDYEIVNSKLVGGNRFVTQDLELGDRVEGDRAVDLPIKLGVSLLTDKNGRITLEFPIEGDLDDPDFGLGNAIGGAVKEITKELTKSPFRILGKLGGGSGDDDFGFVEFKAGTADLGNNATEKLATLVAGADQRPELVLLVEGSWDPEGDALALKEFAFEAEVAKRLGEDGGQSSIELLEKLYRDIASSEALNELRGRHEAEGSFDETAYYRDLRDALVEAQPVDPGAAEALAGARAEAIRGFIVESEGGDESRVRIIDPVALEESAGDGWVRCRLDVAAEG